MKGKCKVLKWVRDSLKKGLRAALSRGAGAGG